jgi:HlyD family secretion protein
MKNIFNQNSSKSSSMIIFLLLVVSSCKKNTEVFDASGVFEAKEIIVSSEAAGKILAMSVEEGADVNEGDVTVKVDCQGLILQKGQTQASIKALDQKKGSASPQVQIFTEQVKVQKSQIAVQREQLRTLDKERLRLDKLVKADAIPSKQLDDIENQIEVIKKQIDVSESQVAVLNQQIKSQQSQTNISNTGILSEKGPLNERVAQINDQISKCDVRNPIQGTVLTKYAELNEFIGIGKPLYRIANMKEMTLRAYVSGTDLGRIKMNQAVKVFIDNGKDSYKELPGTIEWISNKAEFTPKTIQTKDERSNLVYATKIKVKNDGFIKLGMYGEVKF